MSDVASGQNLFNALYPFKSGNLPRTPLGAMFTRSVFFMESCRDQMRRNWQSGGSLSTHQEFLKTFNRWRRQAIRSVETMEKQLDRPHRRAKRFIGPSPFSNGDESGRAAGADPTAAPTAAERQHAWQRPGNGAGGD